MANEDFYREQSLLQALAFIGVNPDDFFLCNHFFLRQRHAPIHGLGHIYRVMMGCALLGQLLNRPREGFLAFCGAYIHDLARLTDGCEPQHGQNAVDRSYPRFSHIWEKYGITDNERKMIHDAVIQHSGHQWQHPGDEGYEVMAILKDADALDRCRIGDLNPRWLRFRESHLLIHPFEHYYVKTRRINRAIRFRDFIHLATQ